MKTSKETKEFFKAFFAAQGGLAKGVKKDSDNPFFKSKYADLQSVVKAALPIIQEHGIIFMQFPGMITDKGQPVTTRLVHAKSGQWIETTMIMPLAKQDAQGVGGAITYASRYSLMAMLGMPPHDDDGESAVGRGGKSAYQARKDGDWPKLEGEIRNCMTPDELKQWGMANRDRISGLPDKWQVHARDEYERCMENLNMRHSQAPLEDKANGKAA